MKNSIFIVTYKRDFVYLRYCLRSCKKFAQGFDEIVISVPNQSFDECVAMARETPDVPIAVRSGDEWKERGMLWAMTQKCRADEWCPTADIIFHIDADCVFTEPVTPAEYVHDNKPVLLYESFHSLCRVKGFTEVLPWQKCTQDCLPFDVNYETMRRHPEIYHRDLYSKTRQLVEQKVNEPFDEYVKKQRNQFPQTFCEFNTLGNVAIQCFSDKYELVNLEHAPWPKSKLRQAWSHRPPTEDDMKAFKELGLE